ncbi:MAG: hypothetical protein LIP03_04310 [Bacteroidales bacterium]|nr:hypothetical protein [Bacteroidales bacterium]
MVRQTDIIQYAKSHPRFSPKEMLDDFSQNGIDASRNAVLVSLNRLVKNGVLKKEGRGIYALAKEGSIPFSPYFDQEMEALDTQLITAFPFLKFCIWNSLDINRFSHHVLNNNIIWIDVEKDGTDAIFSELINSNLKRRVFLRPDELEYERYVNDTPAIVIRALISQAPLTLNAKGQYLTTIEKILVDVTKGPDFPALHGLDILRFFRNAHEVCAVNQAKLLRYAGRRGTVEEIKGILNDMNNIEDYDTYR